MLTWWAVLAVCFVGAAACPQHCSCFTDTDGYRSANCSTLALGSAQPSSLDLVSIQPHEPGYPTKLTPRAFLAFSKVKFLWVVNCSVLNLPNEVFHGLDYVIKMDLSYNKIRHLNGAVFKSLGSLHTLLLRGNPLLLTPWDVIVSDSLQELDLGHCGLRTIPQGTFISVPRLSRLYLDGNEIHTFTFNMIPAVLRYLNLAHNRIVNVPTDVLKTMSYLRKLDLSKNPIKCNCNLLIMQDWFSGQGIIFENGVTCSDPIQYAGQQLSKINENELCTLEEVKRQRRINDIESYRDSKAHRTHNMIHDPDLQADQPNEHTEVLYDDERTRALGTHMEFSKQHYPLPLDLSDENNKLAASKQEIVPTETDHVFSMKKAEFDQNQKVSNEEMIGAVEKFILNSTDTSDEISTEDLSVINQELFSKTPTAYSLTKNVSDDLNLSKRTFHPTPDAEIPSNDSAILNHLLPTDSPENEMADEGYSPLYSNTPHSELNKELHNESILLDQELAEDISHNITVPESVLADEGYSPVYNSTIAFEDEAGSGDDKIDIQDFSPNNVTASSEAATPTTYNFPTSPVDSGDYSYDTHHDYSVEVVHTTEAMNTTTIEEGEGSGDLEDVDLTFTSLPPYVEDDNETTTEDFIIKVESTTDHNVSSDTTSENYVTISSVYTSSQETTYLPLETSTDADVDTEGTEGNTAEIGSETTTIGPIDLFSESSYSSSSSESSVTTSEPMITTEAVLSSSAQSEPAIIITSTEIFTTPSEPPLSSSSEKFIIPIVEADMTTPTHSETVKDTSPTPEVITHSIAESTTVKPSVSDVEVIVQTSKEVEKGQMKIEPTQAEREEARTEPTQSTLTYVIAGLLIALIVFIVTTVVCKKVLRMGPCTSKKKVRLPQDTEANLGTEMQDMLLPKPPENGVKIIPQNGTPNGKEVKEEEIPVLQKDWEEKPEPIETVTARMSIIAGPQTPVFIHKTLA